MFAWGRNGQRNDPPTRRENRPSSRDNEERTAERDRSRGTSATPSLRVDIPWSSRSISPSSIAHRTEGQAIVINGIEPIYFVAFLFDGKQVVGGGREGNIWCWGVEDGREEGTPMNARSLVCSIAASRDENWIVSGTKSGLVTVWSARNHERVVEFTGHGNWVQAVDVSPDGRIATGSDDWTACIWSSTGQRLLGPLQHDGWVLAAKFSPNGRFIATATWGSDSVRVYDSWDGHLLADVPIPISSASNNSLAWTCDSRQLFALSRHGKIHCLDGSTNSTIAKWSIHSNEGARCIALASNGAFIAASADHHVSFWDTLTLQQIGPVIEHTNAVSSMAMSESHDLVVGGGKTLSIRSLCDILPSSYFDDGLAIFEKTVRELRVQLSKSKKACRERDDLIQSMCAQHESSCDVAAFEPTDQRFPDGPVNSQCASDEGDDSEDEIISSLRLDLHTQEAISKSYEENNQRLLDEITKYQLAADEEKDSLKKTVDSLREQGEKSNNKITQLEQINQELRDDAKSQYAADEERSGLKETIESLRSDLHTLQESSNEKIILLEQTNQELRDGLVESRRVGDEQKKSLNETIRSLRSDIHTEETNLNDKITLLERTNQEFRCELAESQHAADVEKESLGKVILALRLDLHTLKTTKDDLRSELAELQHTANESDGTLNETIRSLRADFHAQESNANDKIMLLERTNEELHGELAESRRAADEQQDSLNETIRLMRADLHAQELSSSNKIMLLERANEELGGKLTESQRATDEQKDSLNETIRSLREDLHTREASLNEQLILLERTNDELRDKLSESQRSMDEQKDNLHETIRSLRTDLQSQEMSSNARITLLEQTMQDLRDQLAESQETANSAIRINHAHERMHQCDSLHAQGRIHDAAESLLEMRDALNEDVRSNSLVTNWLAEVTGRCIQALERLGDEASSVEKQDEAVKAYSTAFLLDPSIPNAILHKWARAFLISGSAQEALRAAAEFKLPTFVAYRLVCDSLEWDSRIMEAVECLRQMEDEVPVNAETYEERREWERDFQGRCVRKLEKLGDAARESQKHDEALGYYSNALRFDPENLDILLKRSIESIELNPSSYEGYEGKRTALHSMGRYSEAFEAFRIMLSKLEQSPDPKIHDLRHQYVDATSAIQKEVDKAIRHMPPVLIDTETGYLYDKPRQAEAFKGLPIHDELRSSMTTQLDVSRIRTEVKKFYRYVMFSHRWQLHEPTFQQVEDTSVYKLPLSPEFSKLRNFCKLVCSFRFKWAWSDTCCVNQLDKTVQQESVVAMFRWYRGSSLTVIHLVGILAELQEVGCLERSIWNTRGWTYQEYVASKVVQFYTEDWKPYLGLQIFNHKESPVILSEMEQAMNFTTKELTTLQPGLDRVREKLYLASSRQTTREEDIAYSLFGIFGVALPVIYGEGSLAVGRLLEHILTRSADVALLAWTGSPGTNHSYLPVDLTVYNRIVPPHLPPPLEPSVMDDMATAVRSSSLDLSPTAALYDRLHDLSSLSLVAGRLRLPGIIFPLSDLSLTSISNRESRLPVYHVTSPMLKDITFETRDDLTEIEGLLLVHPWISHLLDQDFSRGMPQSDLATRALRLVVRLRQPFGALLLAPLARAQYKRVATDSLIMVQVREQTSLRDLMDGIRTVDIQ